MKIVAILISVAFVITMAVGCTQTSVTPSGSGLSDQMSGVQNGVSTTTTALDGKTPPQDLLTVSEAKALAFETADVAEQDISRLDIDLDFDDDDNIWEYEIDFYVADIEYNVEIDAATGEVLSFDYDDDDDDDEKTTAPTNLSPESLKEIALFCAGVTEDKIRDYEVELDYDDDRDRWEYELSFEVGRIEYEITVDAVSGELLELEKDIDD